MGLKGPDCILVKGCDKNDGRMGFNRLELRQEGKAIFFGHLDIEENHIRSFRGDEGDRRGDIIRLAYDLDFWMSLEASSQMDSRQWFVIHQNGTKSWRCQLFGFPVHAFMMGSVTTALTHFGECS